MPQNPAPTLAAAGPAAPGLDRVALGLAVLALSVSLAFCLLVYPAAGQSLHANLDPDRWAEIGQSLWRNGVFAYFPETEPIIYRAPLYPGFLSLALAVGGEHAWPQSVQVAQCLLFAGTCLLTLGLGRELFGRRAGTLAALAAALHPMLIWYTSRFWVESLAAFLFTLLLYALARCARGAGRAAHLGAGVALGLCILVKSTYLPFLALAPAGLALARGRAAVGRAVLVAAAAACVVAPWTLRNYRVTGTFIPVHVGAGINLTIADCTVRHFADAPFAYLPVFTPCKEEALGHLAGLTPPGATRSEQELAVDAACLRERLASYGQDPGFLLYKVGFNALMFWVLSESPAKSLALALLQLPILALAGIGAARAVRRSGWRGLPAVLVLLALGYYGLHLPINAVARYSVVLAPVLLVFAASLRERDPA